MVSADSTDHDIPLACRVSTCHRLSMVSSGSKGHGSHHSPPKSTWPSVVTKVTGAMDIAQDHGPRHGAWRQHGPQTSTRSQMAALQDVLKPWTSKWFSLSPQPMPNLVPPSFPPLHWKFIHQNGMETAAHHSGYMHIYLNICKYTHIYLYMCTHTHWVGKNLILDKILNSAQLKKRVRSWLSYPRSRLCKPDCQSLIPEFIIPKHIPHFPLYGLFLIVPFGFIFIYLFILQLKLLQSLVIYYNNHYFIRQSAGPKCGVAELATLALVSFNQDFSQGTWQGWSHFRQRWKIWPT